MERSNDAPAKQRLYFARDSTPALRRHGHGHMTDSDIAVLDLIVTAGTGERRPVRLRLGQPLPDGAGAWHAPSRSTGCMRTCPRCSAKMRFKRSVSRWHSRRHYFGMQSRAERALSTRAAVTSHSRPTLGGWVSSVRRLPNGRCGGRALHSARRAHLFGALAAALRRYAREGWQ